MCLDPKVLLNIITTLSAVLSPSVFLPSMFLAALISKKEITPTSIETKATVELGQDDGPKITSITLDCEAVVPGLSEEDFIVLAKDAKAKCPISRLTTGTDVFLNAKLVS